MDVIFETEKGGSFTIEIGYFDSVYEIKEKIQKYKEIPISKQTLVFNGNVLDDSGNVDSCVILNESRIQLLLDPSFSSEKLDSINAVAEQQQQQQQEVSATVFKKTTTKVVLKVPTSQNQQQLLPLDVELNDSVLQLKEKLHDILEGCPANRLALYVNGNHELQDHRHLREYELTDGSEIEVSIRPPLTPPASAMTNPMPAMTSKKMNVNVLTRCGTRKIVLEVNPTNKVRVLRGELEKWRQRTNFVFPAQYFFIYKQSVLEERQSFQWNNVRPGDVIEMFSGSVSSEIG